MHYQYAERQAEWDEGGANTTAAINARQACAHSGVARCDGRPRSIPGELWKIGMRQR
jgi:hypothetical protein